MTDRQIPQLPTPEQFDRAIRAFLEQAYGAKAPAWTDRFLPPPGFNPAEWVMSGVAERTPPGATLEKTRSFALRIGNAGYPHMKLRISRLPNEPVFLFSVDNHDEFLRAEPDSPDYEPLQALKRSNAAIASAILRAWDAADLPTERRYLRQRIRQDRRKGKAGPDGDASAPSPA